MPPEVCRHGTCARPTAPPSRVPARVARRHRHRAGDDGRCPRGRALRLGQPPGPPVPRSGPARARRRGRRAAAARRRRHRAGGRHGPPVDPPARSLVVRGALAGRRLRRPDPGHPPAVAGRARADDGRDAGGRPDDRGHDRRAAADGRRPGRRRARRGRAGRRLGTDHRRRRGRRGRRRGPGAGPGFARRMAPDPVPRRCSGSCVPGRWPGHPRTRCPARCSSAGSSASGMREPATTSSPIRPMGARPGAPCRCSRSRPSTWPTARRSSVASQRSRATRGWGLRSGSTSTARVWTRRSSAVPTA